MASKAKTPDGMRDHYDFSGGVRGKYAARYAEAANVVVLAPDVPEMFPDSIATLSRAVATAERQGVSHRIIEF